jgi:hypothetical protein
MDAEFAESYPRLATQLVNLFDCVLTCDLLSAEGTGLFPSLVAYFEIRSRLV